MERTEKIRLTIATVAGVATITILSQAWLKHRASVEEPQPLIWQTHTAVTPVTDGATNNIYNSDGTLVTQEIKIELQDDRGSVVIDRQRRWRPYSETGTVEKTDYQIMPPYPRRLLIMLPDGTWMTITQSKR